MRLHKGKRERYKATAANERFHASGGADSSDTEQVTSSFVLVRALPNPPPAWSRYHGCAPAGDTVQVFSADFDSVYFDSFVKKSSDFDSVYSDNLVKCLADFNSANFDNTVRFNWFFGGVLLKMNIITLNPQAKNFEDFRKKCIVNWGANSGFLEKIDRQIVLSA